MGVSLVNFAVLSSKELIERRWFEVVRKKEQKRFVEFFYLFVYKMIFCFDDLDQYLFDSDLSELPF